MSGPPHLPHWIRLTSYSYGVSTAMLAVTLLPVAGTVLAYLSVRLQPHAGLGPTGGVGWWGRGFSVHGSSPCHLR